MPLGFTNLGFETGTAVPGFMSGWTVAVMSLALQFAAYPDIATGSNTAYETFEYSWGADANVPTEFDLEADVTFALYDLIPTKYEDFESEWAGGNQVNYTVLPATILAAYDPDPEDFDSFETHWSSNEDDVTEFPPGGTQLAEYDTAPQEREDFEEEWGGNENYMSEFFPVDLSAAMYDLGGAAEEYEDFEETDLCLARITVTAVGADGDAYRVVINGGPVEYLGTGVGPESAIRDIIMGQINAQFAGIAEATDDGGATMKIRSATNGVNLTIGIEVTGIAKMTIAIPDKTEYWTQLGEL